MVNGLPSDLKKMPLLHIFHQCYMTQELSIWLSIGDGLESQLRVLRTHIWLSQPPYPVTQEILPPNSSPTLPSVSSAHRCPFSLSATLSLICSSLLTGLPSCLHYPRPGTRVSFVRRTSQQHFSTRLHGLPLTAGWGSISIRWITRPSVTWPLTSTAAFPPATLCSYPQAFLWDMPWPGMLFITYLLNST